MKHIKKLELLEKIVTNMNSTQSEEELLNYLIDKCIETTGALTGSIMLINEETKVLDIKVFRGLKRSDVLKTKLKVGEGVTGNVALNGNPILIRDVDKVDYYVRVRDDLQSELALPLKIENKIIGVISVDSDKKQAFSEDDMGFLHTLSKVASQILQKANLIGNLKSTINNQELLLKIALVLEKTTEIDVTFESVMKLISSAFHINRGILALLDEKNDLKILSGYKLSEEAIQRGVYRMGEGIMGKVLSSGKGIAIKDISKNKDFLNKMKIRRSHMETSSFFALPIKFENNTIGVLGVEKKYESEKVFKETYKLLTIISSLISQKVQNYEKNRKEKEKLVQKNKELKKELIGKESDVIFIGKNEKMLEIVSTIQMVADTEASVLIQGQTGTGKEVLARMLHYKSRRWDKPFIGINCASIPENLLESELFGYKKGAFTGAVQDKKGKFMLAQDGTLFLDEIGDLSFSLQAKILRVLQEKVVEPLGSEQGFRVNVRIVSATNKDLEEQIRKNEFREDLYYRLNVIPVMIPSLSDRQDDIPLFVDYFVKIFNKKYNKTIQGISDRCLQSFMNYSWIGNIRELENVIERSVILSRRNVIDLDVISSKISGGIQNLEVDDQFQELLKSEILKADRGKIYKDVIQQVEKYLIEYALIEHNNKQSEASEYLGVHRNTLHAKIKEYQI